MTSDRRVAFDGLPDPELELEPGFEGLAWCVDAPGGETGAVELVLEVVGVSEVATTVIEAGLYWVVTA